MIFGLILAGGKGLRMGKKLPKQYIKIGGRAIISYSAECFVKNEKIDRVIILVPKNRISYTRELISQDFYKTDKIDIIEGASLRNDTIIKGIDFVSEHFGIDDNTFFITHDAARPFVTKEIIDKNIEALKEHNACNTVIPATDTIISSNDGKYMDEVPDRSKLYMSQTPQSFRGNIFKKYYLRLGDRERQMLTDATKVFVLNHENVFMVEGDTKNIKITHSSDLIFAEAIINSGKK